MAIDTQKRRRVPVKDLASGIPSVPVFEGEDNIDAGKEASAFLKQFEDAIQGADWDAFGELFSDDCFWRDSLTLTFDKRTLKGRQSIVEAWKTLSSSRKPTNFSLEKDDDMTMDARFTRMAPTMASLDVPFSFSTDTPKSKCIGQFKLIPQDEKWKIWVLGTAIVSLLDYPFAPLPRQSPSMIDASQRGKPKAQGLPKVEGILDAVVIGGSCSGLMNTIMLDSLGANVVALEMEAVPGGNWSTKRYQNLTVHHPAFMIQLPKYPVPDGYPNYLTGRDITRYYSGAVEALQLPFFGGIKVISNTFDRSKGEWRVQIQDLQTGEEAILLARNIVISTGFVASHDSPNMPNLNDQHLFQGIVQHTTQYRTSEPYKGKNVIVVGSGNSAHDVAKSLALGGANDVTILQRSPTVLLNFDAIAPMFTMLYQGNIPVDTADFLFSLLPIGIMRDMAKGAVGSVIQSQEELNTALESKGYVLDKTPCIITKAYDERGRSFYIDQPKTFDLVLSDRIKIARGEAKGFVEDGLVVHDKTEGKDKVLKAGGVVFATGYNTFDLPKTYAQTGFIDPAAAALLENVTLFGVDEEGETPGQATYSGHPHLYFSGIGFHFCRWLARYIAVQVMVDVKKQLPSRYPRQSS